MTTNRSSPAAYCCGNKSRLLCHPHDRLFLSEVLCFVRSQIEAFVSSPTVDDDGRPCSRKAEGAALPGRVGIRCIHCAGAAARVSSERSANGGPSPSSTGVAAGLTKRAVQYPSSIRLVYQAVRNWQRHHMMACPSMPEEVKRQYAALKAEDAKRRSSSVSGKYWEDSCRRMGMIDTLSGIQLRSGRFVEIEEEIQNDEVVLDGSMVSLKRSLLASKSGLPVSLSLSERCSASEKASDNLPENCHEEGDVSSIHATEETSGKMAQPDPRCSNNNSLGSISISNESLLERVKYALGVVNAANRIRPVVPLPLLLAAAEESKTAGFNPTRHRQHEHQQHMSSLGADLYELFSGRSPYWQSDDGNGEKEKLELDSSSAVGTEDDEEEGPMARCRLKRRDDSSRGGVTPLSELGLPPVLCCLVHSLLEYRADGERNDYTCMAEVEEDLRAIAAKPERFLYRTPTGELIFNSNFLYGRDEETSALLEAYNRAVSDNTLQNSVALVSGYSGTGKSSLVWEAIGRFREMGAICVSGKFDAMQQPTPLSAIASAVNDLCGLLAQDLERAEEVKMKAAQSALGVGGGRLLADLMPNVGRLIPRLEDDGPLLQIGGREAMQRLLFLFRGLFRAACSCSNPVVLFLDDLQWADAVSLELMQTLVMDVEMRGLFIIGAFRDNEVASDSHHPLALCLDGIHRSGSTDVHSVHVFNLNLDSVNSLISDALCLTPRLTQSLAEAVTAKTGGNALFVVQFVVSLRDEGLLRLNLASKRWEWDVEQVKKKNIADNVVELMTTKLLGLAPEVHEALKVSAAFGAQCQDALFQILDRAPDSVMSTVSALNVAVSEGLLVKTECAYRFPHDQIQRAAYLLVPESARDAFHLRIGRLLQKWSSAEEMDSFLFVIVDQLHRGAHLITDCDERTDVSQLSLMAGRKAADMSAFLPALAFVQAGIGLLTDEHWCLHQDLCIDLHNTCAEIEYILGEYDGMKRHLDVVLMAPTSLGNKLRAYCTLIQSLGSQGCFFDAIDNAIEALGEVGEFFPVVITKAAIQEELLMSQELFHGRSEGSLLQLDVMDDGAKREAMKLLMILTKYVYTVKKEYFPLVVCRMVRLSLQHGLCKESAYGFASFGVVLISLGDYALGNRFGKLALSFHDKFHAKDITAKVHTCVYALINPWTEPIQSTLPHLRDAVDAGLAAGDTEYAFVAATFYMTNSFWSGRALGPLAEEIEKLLKQMLEYKQLFTHSTTLPTQAVVLYLLGRSECSIKAIREVMGQNMTAKVGEDSESVRTTVRQHQLCFQMYLEYLFGEYDLAWETAEKKRESAKERHGVGQFSLHCSSAFFSGLTALALARREGRRKYTSAIDEAIDQMKVWATSTPWNCEHRLELMKAEYSYLEGDISAADKSYRCAAKTASDHRFINDEALALERAGIFHFELGDHDVSSRFFSEARSCYGQWGAHWKAAHVK